MDIELNHMAERHAIPSGGITVSGERFMAETLLVTDTHH